MRKTEREESGTDWCTSLISHQDGWKETHVMPSGTQPPPMPGGSNTPEPLPLPGRRQLLIQSARIRSWLTRPVGKVVLVVLGLVVISSFFFVRSLPHPSGGNAWVLQQNVGTSRDLHGVVWSGTQFVAVGAQGTILTSP